MRSALYYPSWGIADPRFMFESLLYWDSLTCIVPFEGFRPHADWPGLEREAMEFHERFVRGLEPTAAQKESAHRRLADILEAEPPDWCRADSLTLDSASNLAVRKLSSRTVDMLCRNGWLANQEADSMAKISSAAMGIVLATLADEMSSPTMPALTDNPLVFRTACNSLLRELQAQEGLDLEGGQFHKLGTPDTGDPELSLGLARVMRLGVEEADISPEMLRRLRRLREDSGFDAQRELFCEQVDRYLDDLRERAPSEHPSVHEHWRGELTRDRQALKKELRLMGLSSIVERDGVVAVGVAAAAGGDLLELPEPLGLLVAVVVGGGGILESARRRRVEIRNSHWTSWLMTATRSRPAGFGP